ncbi:DUF1330 domain-containing protein [Streptomyces sp. NK15101]|uniref:DUF1330 domain-containing protein n=1 Tax=Streptomyces sp. NK15101 TaxID=2873261 RepID=UPI001CEDA605|nr:DUF1330 domain-containing protein [Streptomyces sp. NK15101]
MTAYAIGNLHPEPVLNDEVFVYMEHIQATLDPFGGRFLVHGAPAREVREGTWPGAVVIIGFPTFEDARGWYDSDAYQALIPLRTRHMAGDILLVDGTPEGYDPVRTAAHLRGTRAAAAGDVRPDED